MSTEQKKAKILAVIEARGWCAGDLYLKEARELVKEGKITYGTRYSVGGNIKPVWVAA